MDKKEWFGVKSIICHKKKSINYLAYEERVVLFLANDFDDAIEQAEKEANEYCLNDKTVTNCKFYNAYKIFDAEIKPNTEIFSNIVDSNLDIEHFLELHYPNNTNDR